MLPVFRGTSGKKKTMAEAIRIQSKLEVTYLLKILAAQKTMMVEGDGSSNFGKHFCHTVITYM